MDANSDGKLTDDEIPERAKAFMDLKKMDTNKDGGVDKAEFIKAMEEAMKRFQGGGGGGAPGA